MPAKESRDEILAQMVVVFKEIFDDDGLEVTERTNSKDVDAWDSLMHVTLCVALEQKFGVRLNANEIANYTDVGSLLNKLCRELK